jgi:L-lactate dehydrogenase complex protein LldE
MITRSSPKHKPVSLFVTCMVDTLYPAVGQATVAVLEHLGLQVRFPRAQTCCGQPAFNAGFWDDARPVARQFLRAFRQAEVIVTPSGSCASMIRHYYPTLFEDDPRLHQQAVDVASRTWELSEFLVDGLGITDLGARHAPVRVGFHHACHGLRLGNLRTQAQALVTAVDGVSVVDVAADDVCCGFGGLFAVKMPRISNAMLQDKVSGITSSAADVIITGDCGCLAQINGGLAHQGHPPRVQHLAELLAESLPQTEQEPKQ